VSIARNIAVINEHVTTKFGANWIVQYYIILCKLNIRYIRKNGRVSEGFNYTYP